MANHTEGNLRKIESPTVDNVTGEPERRKKHFHQFAGTQNFANE